MIQKCFVVKKIQGLDQLTKVRVKQMVDNIEHSQDIDSLLRDLKGKMDEIDIPFWHCLFGEFTVELPGAYVQLVLEGKRIVLFRCDTVEVEVELIGLAEVKVQNFQLDLNYFCKAIANAIRNKYGALEVELKHKASQKPISLFSKIRNELAENKAGLVLTALLKKLG